MNEYLMNMNMNFDSRQSWWGSSDEGHLLLISGSAAILG